jgi:hypothetical protein
LSKSELKRFFDYRESLAALETEVSSELVKSSSEAFSHNIAISIQVQLLGNFYDNELPTTFFEAL